jgi:hypothetical protein
MNQIVYAKDLFVPSPQADKVINAFLLQVWVLRIDIGNREKEIFKNEDGEEGILFVLPGKTAHVGLPMRIIRLKSIPVILALMPSFLHSQFSDKYPFGFQLSSPGEKVRDGTNTWHVMYASYPNFIEDNYEYLDYEGPASFAPNDGS